MTLITVVLVGWLGMADPFSQAQVQATWQTVAQDIAVQSGGKMTLQVSVLPWRYIAKPAKCPDLAIRQPDISGAHVVYVWPEMDCGYKGITYGSFISLINGFNEATLYEHEFGHQLGFMHAGSLRCLRQMCASGGAVAEQGDPYTVMGSGTIGYTAYEKTGLGWVDPPQHYTGGVQTFTLRNGGLTVPSGSKRTYWLEYNKGLQLRIEPPFENAAPGITESELLDMTPDTVSFKDGSLGLGQVYTDGNVNIGVVQMTPDQVTVMIGNCSALPVTPPPPPAACSADGTTVTDSKGSLYDGSGNTWTLRGPGTSTGTGVDAQTATVVSTWTGLTATKLTIKGCVIYGQHRAGDWYTAALSGTLKYGAGAKATVSAAP